jgi:hypothetical protein
MRGLLIPFVQFRVFRRLLKPWLTRSREAREIIRQRTNPVITLSLYGSEHCHSERSEESSSAVAMLRGRSNQLPKKGRRRRLTACSRALRYVIFPIRLTRRREARENIQGFDTLKRGQAKIRRLWLLDSRSWVLAPFCAPPFALSREPLSYPLSAIDASRT